MLRARAHGAESVLPTGGLPGLRTLSAQAKRASDVHGTERPHQKRWLMFDYKTSEYGGRCSDQDTSPTAIPQGCRRADHHDQRAERDYLRLSTS